MLLKISTSIRNEWQVRAITDVIPSLAQIPWEMENVIFVDNTTAKEIRADCSFYLDPNAVDATVGERSAYRALMRQIDAAGASSENMKNE
jgi:hypothetical protein